jgi:hypothetical protein
MALIENDFSSREAYFETGNPVNEPYWSDLFKGLRDNVWGVIGMQYFEISRQTITDAFNSIRDLSGLLIASSFQQFENYCKANGIKFFVNENGNYIVSKDWDNFYMNDGKLYKRIQQQ